MGAITLATFLSAESPTCAQPPKPPELKADAIPVTGRPCEQLAGFDRFMLEFLDEHAVPGGALAIARNGRLVYARGYGYADKETKEPVRPRSLFRIASVSKPITAVAILRLAQRGKLKLRDHVVDYLDGEPFLPEGAKADDRWQQITIRHCLTHTGGWDRDKSFDPMFQSQRMAKEMDIELPVGPRDIIRYMRGQPLDFNPGERYAYSNFGFCVLGRVIEKVTGQPYETYVQRDVLRPLGIDNARIGRSLAGQRAEGEVRYYTAKDFRETAVTGPEAGKAEVPISYGAWNHEALDAHGGWIASAVDLVRFGSACAGENDSKLLRKRMRRRMTRSHVRIRPPQNGDGGAFYGFGWVVLPENPNTSLPENADSPGRQNEPEKSGSSENEASSDKPDASATAPENVIRFQHGGALPCTAATLMHLPEGITIAVLMNQGQTPDRQFLGRQLDGPLVKLAREVEAWPEGEPFSR